MITKRSKSSLTRGLKAALAKEPAMTVKDLADRLDVNRQFMAGFLAALEERGEISCRKVGPARIYFNIPEGMGPANGPQGAIPARHETKQA